MLRIVALLDLVVIALALPAFLIAGWPLLGYGAVTAAWLLQRGIRAYALRRALASGERRAVIAVIGGSMVGRIWLMGLSVLFAGLIEREAAVAGGLFAVALFTVQLGTTMVVKPLPEARG